MLINANSLNIPLADKSVQCVVTSPPYFALRNYGINGQIGMEQTPAQYLDQIVAVFAEVHRVLRDDGSIWVNMGDSWFAPPAGSASVDYIINQTKGDGAYARKFRNNHQGTLDKDNDARTQTGWNNTGLRPKNILGMPWRVAFALQDYGWYLRSDIIWYKPNAMPERITDRPAKAHDYIFLLTKSSKYFYDNEAVKQPSTQKEQIDNTCNLRSVWTIPTQPYKESHFATYPEKLVEPCILAGTSQRGQCKACGSPWVRILEKGELISVDGTSDDYVPKKSSDDQKIKGRSEGWTPNHIRLRSTSGWRPSCSCNAGEPVPQIVLDPFSGSGTTGRVAARLNRDYVGIELNPEYLKLHPARMTVQTQITDW